MAYDEQLAARVREQLGTDARITEMKMFGGLAFLVNGNMAIAVSGQGGLLVRVDPAAGDQWIDGDSVAPMEMRGREMPGWLRVAAEVVDTESSLAEWADRGTRYAESLPVKARG